MNSWIVEPQITFNRKIKRNKFDVLIGTTFQQNNNNSLRQSGTGYTNDLVLEDIHSASTVKVESALNSQYKYSAIFGRLNYNLEDKYIVNLTARRDGSSRFGSENQFHNFGAIGLAWIFSEETFLKDNFPFMSFGKLRGSYGTTGNDQIDDYQFLNLYNPTSSTVPYQGAKGLLPNGLPNPYLAWEETKKLQLGLDIGVLNDRVLLNLNYYRNRSSNLLVGNSLPIVTGFGSVIENLPATVQNTGWELMLQATIFKHKNFGWSSNISLTIPRNKLVSFPDIENSSSANFLVIGQPISIRKVFHFADVDSETGVFRFFDSHGNPTSTPDNIKDAYVIIKNFPSYYGGWQNTLIYKKFQLDIFVQFVTQNGPNKFFGSNPGTRSNNPISILDRWQRKGDIASHQRFSQDNSISDQYFKAVGSDAAYSNASFAKLKNVSASWTLPESLMNRLKVKSTRLFIHAQNLLTITKYVGLDPETLSSSVLPPLRTITVGLQMTL
jgi:hypothetical protein